MQVSLVVVGLGIVLRIPDRLWHSVWLGRHDVVGHGQAPTYRKMQALQSRRANDVTPVLLALGHWLEIAGWWMLCRSNGSVAWCLVALLVAVKMRHLQELTHFAVHGSLARSPSVNDIIGEVAFQSPLYMPSLPERRQSHVREHHPNATDNARDPNIAELRKAGFVSRSSRRHRYMPFIAPLSMRYLSNDLAHIIRTFKQARFQNLHHNCGLLLMPIILCLLLGGPAALIFGLLLPRLVLYRMLSWMSMLVEHNWFVAHSTAHGRLSREADRCIRLYESRPLLKTLTRATWLPYGDLFHYAHSVYPRLRWNYLCMADHLLPSPSISCRSVIIGSRSVRSLVFGTDHKAGEDLLSLPS